MATIQLPPDFKDFLKLLNSAKIEYLVIGGYAVGLHGHPRATGDLDIWIPPRDKSRDALRDVLKQFGFSADTIDEEFQLHERQVIRMGTPPLRIEVVTSPSGVAFDDCYARRETQSIDEIDVTYIALTDLRINKAAAGRAKDLADLDNLPEKDEPS